MGDLALSMPASVSLSVCLSNKYNTIKNTNMTGFKIEVLLGTILFLSQMAEKAKDGIQNCSLLH